MLGTLPTVPFTLQVYVLDCPLGIPSGLMSTLLVIGLVLAQAEPVRFFPEDAEVSCQAILPQCFRRSDWANLCNSQPEIRASFAEACREAVKPC